MSEKKKALRFSDIEAAKAAELELLEVDVPEWGGTIYLKVLDARAAFAFGTSLYDKDGKFDLKGSHARIVHLCACDETGAPIFATEDDVWARNIKIVNRLADKALVLNGFKDAEKKTPVAVAKNDSGETTTEGSPTASPSTSLVN